MRKGAHPFSSFHGELQKTYPRIALPRAKTRITSTALRLTCGLEYPVPIRESRTHHCHSNFFALTCLQLQPNNMTT
jgi:hypothetical protein